MDNFIFFIDELKRNFLPDNMVVHIWLGYVYIWLCMLGFGGSM